MYFAGRIQPPTSLQSAHGLTDAHFGGLKDALPNVRNLAFTITRSSLNSIISCSESEAS